MAYTLAQLKSELLTDPAAVGYAANITAGAQGKVAEQINAVNGAILIPRSNVTPQEILEAIRIQDLNATTNVAHGSWFESVMQTPAIRLLTTTGTDTRLLNNIMFLLSNGSGSETRLRALATRPGSRAEQLWGEYTVVPVGDVQAALAP